MHPTTPRRPTRIGSSPSAQRPEETHSRTEPIQQTNQPASQPASTSSKRSFATPVSAILGGTTGATRFGSSSSRHDETNDLPSTFFLLLPLPLLFDMRLLASAFSPIYQNLYQVYQFASPHLDHLGEVSRVFQTRSNP